MRGWLGLMVAILLAGCGESATGVNGSTPDFGRPLTEDGDVYARSTYEWHTSGLWLPAAVTWSIGGIAGRTCQMEFLSGAMTTDLDLGEGTDTVFDGVDLGGDLGATVLVDAVGGLSTVAFPTTEVTATWDVPNVLDAGLSELGPVALTATSNEQDGCSVEWPSAWGVSQTISPASCEGIEVDPDGTAFVGGDVIVRARTFETTEIGTHADRLAWNSEDQLLYAAWSDDPVVRALDVDGNLVWQADLGGDVEGLDDLGNGYVLASVERDRESSEVVILGPDGAEVVRQVVRELAHPVVAAPDGSTFALVDGGHVDFFGVLASVFVR